MTTIRPLEILLVESHPHRGDLTVEALTGAGHHVHRCSEHPNDGFSCRGMARPSMCPIDTGPIDVTVVCRGTAAVRSTRYEQGVRCAVRVGIPVVEESRSPFDPWAELTVERVEGDSEVVDACARASTVTSWSLAAAVRERIERLLRAAAIDPGVVAIACERHGSDLDVTLRVPGEASRALRHALSVRVLDAVRGSGLPTLGQVGVHVQAAAAGG
jgi:hypothetical protein